MTYRQLQPHEKAARLSREKRAASWFLHSKLERTRLFQDLRRTLDDLLNVSLGKWLLTKGHVSLDIAT